MGTPDIAVRAPVRGSRGAHTLRTELGDRARLTRRNVLEGMYDTVINWGNSEPIRTDAYTINHPDAVAIAIDKRQFLSTSRANGISVPDFTTDKTQVQGSKDIWLARTKVKGSEGEGIIVIRPGDIVPDAKLYTKYVPKRDEFRIHIAFGKLLFLQQKKKINGKEQTKDERLVRNYKNGWIFAIKDISAPHELIDEAEKAVSSIGLHFGAVDCMMGKNDNKPYVLEVNTAPALESPSLIAAYIQAFQEELGDG